MTFNSGYGLWGIPRIWGNWGSLILGLILQLTLDLRCNDASTRHLVQISSDSLSVKSINMTGKESPPVDPTTVFNMDLIPGTELMTEGEGGEGVHLTNGSKHDMQ